MRHTPVCLLVALLCCLWQGTALGVGLPDPDFKGADDPSLRSIAARTLDPYGFTVVESKHSAAEWKAFHTQLKKIASDQPSEFAFYLLSGVCQTLSREPGDVFAIEGLDAAEKLLAAAPTNAWALAEYAAALEEMPEREADVLSYARKALEVDPDCLSALLVAADALDAGGNALEAETLVRHAVELAPDLALAHNKLGCTLMVLGRFAEAAASLKTALLLEPADKYSLSTLGHCFIELGRYSDAERCFKAALALAPEHANALYGMARLASSREDSAEALDYLNRALAARPDFEQALNQRAILFQETGKQSESRADYEAAIALAPDDPVMKTNFATLLLELGLHEEAVGQLEAAFSLSEGDAWDWCNYAESLYLLGRFDESLKAVEHGLTIEKLGPLFSTRALVLTRLGRYSEAIESMQSAIKQDEEDPQYHYGLGTIYELAGDLLLARREYERVLQLDPGDEQALANLTNLLEGGARNPAVD